MEVNADPTISSSGADYVPVDEPRTASTEPLLPIVERGPEGSVFQRSGVTTMRTRVLVVTGGHNREDVTKWSAGYAVDQRSLHEQMVEALRTLPKYRFEFPSEDEPLLERLLMDSPDLVLNLCDTGLQYTPAGEPHLPALLELLDIPYTGAGPRGIVLCHDKHVVERVAATLDVPVPRSIYLEPGATPSEAQAFYPALIKPVHGDGGVGIFPQSVVQSPGEAARHFAWLRSNMPRASLLWQEYLPGPEYAITLIGNRATGFTALSPLEVDYTNLPAELPRILPFKSSTHPETRYSDVQLRAAQLHDDVLRDIQRRAERLFVRLECRDYARFDFRTSTDGEIRLLDANPNPDWSGTGRMAAMAQYDGNNHAELLGMILDAAWTRISASAPVR